ncbi:PIG-L deacetylase family protein [Clostridium manihotivorum]|uniref:LmbE family protein n=1 Tax=Clostridium manihotivorum TaxID=2320868 RepID=A0A410DNF5_9CLOT|nr:PIG-L deacetylase family protein [Clostridium manihotivorum]QAA30589.1 LmbE family protein [Clostridium manihotivorum]
MFNKVLVLAPHTDDGELGCGGTIARFVEEGAEVYYAAFSVCELSLQSGLPKNTLEVEVREATKELGIKPENLYLYKYAVRTFSNNRQTILDDLIKLRENLKPELILMPSLQDIHQDHQIIANEGVRAFKKSSILGYEMVWNNLSFNTQVFFVLQDRHIQKKVRALSCYRSQSHRDYLNEEFIKSLSMIRGVQIGERFAEVFEAVRWVNR